jgi:hypothetical protein
MRRLLPALIVALAAATASPASAQSQAMPDASQMSGIPLPGAELPDGTVSVRVVRERMGNNISGQPVRLKVGERTLTETTDAQGRAQFGGIAPGTAVVAETTVDGETLTSQEFPVPPRGGVRVALVAGAAKAAEAAKQAAAAAASQPARSGVVVFGADTRVIMEWQDDQLAVFYLLDLVNSARTPIDTGGPLVMDLPTGAAGAALMEGSSKLASLRGTRLVISGPFPPGTTSVQVAFTWPTTGATATLAQTWPAAVQNMVIAGEKVGDFAFTSPQLGQVQDANSNGTPFLMAMATRIDQGQALTLNLTGLPHHATWMTNAALALAFVILAVGFGMAFSRPPQGQDERKKQLEAKREKLFADLAGLEAQHAQGRVDAARYADRKAALLAQLERVYGELDRAGGEGLAA